MRAAVDRALSLLAPGGLLLLIEGGAPHLWLDLVFGLTEGWWKFSDEDLRPKYPLLTAAAWIDLLRELGFDQAVAVPQSDGAHDPFSQQSILLARFAKVSMQFDF